MTLPISGPISFSAIETELSLSGQQDINNATIRSLVNKPSGSISFSDFRGASLASITPTGVTLYSGAGYLIERIGTTIRVTVSCSSAVAVWDFPADYGYADFVTKCVSGSDLNNAYASLQTHYGHSAVGFGYVSYDGTNVLIVVDCGTYSYDFPPNPTYGTFIANNGLGIGAGGYTQAIADGRETLAESLNTNITPSSLIQHGYPGYVSKFFPARRIP
jgi:hypothetical protein